MLTLEEAREDLRRHKAAREAEEARREAEKAAQPVYRVYCVKPICALFHKLPSFTVPVDSFREWAMIDHCFSSEQVKQCQRDIEENGRGFLEAWLTCYIVESA